MAIAAILFMTAFVGIFGVILVVFSSNIGPKLPRDKVKHASYECGIEVQDKQDTKVSVKFYLTAILFIIFDIEIIFMYPWAITFKEFVAEGLGLQVLIAMGIFLLVFIFGLFWEVKSKALEWE